MSDLAQTDNSPTAPLRVGCVIHWFPKPSETFVFDEIKTLSRLNPGTEIFTLYGPCPGAKSPDLSDNGLAIQRMGIRSIGRLFRDQLFWLRRAPKTTRRLWRTIPFRKWRDWEMAGENLWAFCCGFSLARRATEKQLTHLHAWWGNGPATAAWTASQLAGIPFSFTTWAGDIFPPDGALTEKIRDSRFARSTSQAFVPHLQEQARPDAGKVVMLHNGQDPTRYPPAPAAFRQPVQLLALGRFVPKKGYPHALEAVAILKRKGVPVHLTLAGDGSERRHLMQKARESGISDQVSFPGFVPRHQVPELLQKCDVFLMPSQIDARSNRDGIPNVILEALLCERPVIAADTGAIAEVIEDGVTGRLVPSEDPQALADAIATLAGDPNHARALARAGRERVLAEFDLKRNTAKLLERIQEDGM